MVKKSGYFMSLTVALFVLCGATATVGAQVLYSMDKEPGTPISSVAKEPKQAAIQVIEHYFNALKNPEKDLGTPVESYRIVDMDATDPNCIRVGAAVVYTSSPEEMPVTNFFVVKEKDHYVVKSQKVTYDMIPNSPTYGSIISGKVNELN